MRYPNLRHLEIFRTLVQTLSVTETAQSMNISQPAVSKAMTQLQDTVGVVLFKRVQGRLRPSEDGLRILAEAERLLNQVLLFNEELTALHEARHGRLAIAAIPALGVGAIAASVGRFMAQHPKVLIDFSTDMSPRIVEGLVQNEIELAFVHGDPQNLNIKATFIAEQEMVCQIRHDHRLADKAVIEPKDLIGEPLIFLNPASPPNHLIRESFAKVGVHPNVVAEVNASHLSGPMLVGGGVAFVDPISAARNTPVATVLRKFKPVVPLRIYAISSALRPASRLALAFQAIASRDIAYAISQSKRDL